MDSSCCRKVRQEMENGRLMDKQGIEPEIGAEIYESTKPLHYKGED